MENRFIAHRISESIGVYEKSMVELVADTNTGETELVISKTITERYPITEYEKVMSLYKHINRGGGRRIWKLEEL